MVTVKKVSYNGWTNCIRISDETVEMIVTTDVGPRIISYGFCGKKNHLYNAKEDGGKIGGADFRFYGGHRLWHAPEHNPRTYQPDNLPVSYQITEDGVKLFPITEAATGLAKAMRIRLVDSHFIVDHRITNNGLFPIELSGWALTMFDGGGLLVVPNNSIDSGLVSNRAIALWPYSKMNDERVYWGDKYITVTQKNIGKPFKFGATVDDGYAAYFHGGDLIIKYFMNYAGEEYPNYSCNMESYTDDNYLEIESLTPLETLQPDDFVEFTEVFEIFDNVAAPDAKDEQAIDDIIAEFVDCGCEDDCDCGCGDEDCDCGCNGDDEDCDCDCCCEDDECNCDDEDGGCGSEDKKDADCGCVSCGCGNKH